MRMLYRVPGAHKLDGIMCDYTTVADTAQAIADAARGGWAMSPAAALEASLRPAPEPVQAVESGPREELVKLAESIGIKVDGRWSVARIRQEIDRADDEAE